MKTGKSLIKAGKLIFCILLCEFAGIVGSVFTMPAITSWYSALNKPSFSPPNWVFGPVWTSLYLLMGIALYLIWQKKNKLAIGIFGAQLLVNVIWSYLFFGLKSPLLGFIDIILLLILIIVAIINFYKVSKPASYLMMPYLAWVCIATILNYFIWILN